MSLLTIIDNWRRAAPSRPAHVSGDRILTYGELGSQSDALARYLIAALPDDKSPVAVLGHKEPEQLVAFLGAVKAGHPYVPLDTSLPAKRIERILAASGAAVVLTPTDVAQIVEARGVDSPDGGALAVPRVLAPEDPYYIIFTSGSTGEPKGVVITLGCLESFVDWMLGEQRFTEGEVFLNQAPFSFDLSVMDLYLSLATGGTLFSITKDDIANPRQLYQAFAASGVSVWVSTPSFAQMALAERTFAEAMLPRARKFLFCGETLPPEVAGQLLQRFPRAEVWNTYGPTEATVATTSVRVTRELLERHNPLPVGYAKPDARVLTLDEEGQPTAPSKRGELVIAGPNVSPGYLGRPDLTERAFFQWEGQRAYRTGDWGRVDADGLIFFDGRRDSQVKLHGYRIELGDVEAHLNALDGVREAVVLPVLKNGQPAELAAFVVMVEPPDGAEFALTQALRARLGERLPSYMVPRRLVFLNAFPMTTNGKVDRRKLAEMLA